jgi:hypothetical protein
MKCKDIWVCLCAYLMDGDLDPEKMKALKESPDLCPRCRSCSERNRQRELGLQKYARAMIQDRLPNIMAPAILKESLMIELERAEEYRESGIPPLGLIRWGTHIAQIYKDKGEMAEVLVPYIENGLADNELCAWVTSEMSVEEARETISKEIPDTNKYINTGQLQFCSCQDWYLPSGRFDVQHALDKAHRKYQEALSNGYSGLRITGNSFWLEESDWDSFMQYEGLLDDAVQTIKALVVCTYKESKCNKDNIDDVMNKHAYVIYKMDNSWRLRK